MGNATYLFLPWFRQGVISAVQEPVGAAASRAELKVNLHIGGSQAPATVNVQLFGPGDVTGFDPRQVIRTEPAGQATGVERNYFPFVEFDRPDFPWLFTPTAPAAAQRGRLQPWICLVVLARAACELRPPGPGQPLPVLHVKSAKLDLPDLAQAWAWAHVQVAGAPSELESIMRDHPRLNLSRLVCPRLLAEKTAFLACIVPTYEVGRQAGLGLPVVDAQGLAPAWTAATGAIDLPVYYHWEFTTGEAGDFESLVWRLKREQTPAGVGHRPMRVPAIGSWLPDGGIVGLEGILQGGSAGAQTPASYRGALRDILNAPASATSADPSSLLVAPPIYGCWHAGRRTVPADSQEPHWLRELNLDPRYRATAGLGAHVVQDHQEQLMAAAWEQAGDIERANQALRQAQLARAASRALYRGRLADMPEATFLALTAPLQSRVLGARDQAGARRTVSAAVRASKIPSAALSPAFRRLTRRQGSLARRVGGDQAQWTGALIERLNRDDTTVVPPHGLPEGAVTLEAVYRALDRDPLPLCAVRSEAVNNATVAPGDPQAALKRALKPAAAEHQASALVCDPPAPPPPPPLPLDETKAELFGKLDPDITVAAHWGHRIAAEGWQPADPLEPIMIAPEFPAPMYRPLVELGRDWLLPGLRHIPPDTITSLTPNRRFIEAYMVGLNHEMARELLWRGFPTDQRGTYFRQFWDPGGHVPPPTTAAEREALRDLQGQIARWDGSKGLGEHLSSGASADQLVLLIRGELLARYPGTLISMAAARWTASGCKQVRVLIARGAPGFVEKYAIFQAQLEPDITLLGFDLGPEAARGSPDPADQRPGWFFVIQQQPTEPRFGLDETEPGVRTGRWSDLSWKNVPRSSPEGYVDLGRPLTLASGAPYPLPTVAPDPDMLWGAGTTSAQLAYITLQPPLRVAIHASDLLW